MEIFFSYDRTFVNNDQAVNVHCLVQAVIQRLPHQRVIRYLPLTADVFQAGQLVGKHHCNEVFRLVALPLGRKPLAVSHALHRE